MRRRKMQIKKSNASKAIEIKNEAKRGIKFSTPPTLWFYPNSVLLLLLLLLLESASASGYRSWRGAGFVVVAAVVVAK